MPRALGRGRTGNHIEGHGQGINMAAYFEIDDVIDPADTRRWIATLFDDRSAQRWWTRPAKKRPYVDTW
jgi:hypothetical protein